jgi:hypothetical protein
MFSIFVEILVKMVNVYRIEHSKTGLGFFTHTENNNYHYLVDIVNSYYDKIRENSKSKTHRTIANDLIIDFNENILCGCLSLKDVEYWFGPFLKDIINNGFDIVNYNVKSIIETKSMTQIGFYEKDVINKKIIKSKC